MIVTTEDQMTVDVCVLEHVLREINNILDEDLVFYNYEVEVISSHVITESRPETSTD